MIRAKITVAECLGFDKPNYFVYRVDGYIGEEKAVHNLKMYENKPSLEQINGLEEKWNNPVWQERNGLRKFLNSILPRNLRIRS